MLQSSVGVGRQFASGAIWISVARVWQVGTSLIAAAVLARLLAPSDYGVVAMVTVITGFINIFRTLGTTSAVIQRRYINPAFLASIFWANVLLGLLATAAGIILAPGLAGFYEQPLVEPVMFWLSFSFLVSGMSSTQEAILARAMQFRTIAVVEVTASLCYAATGVGMAMTQYGVWSLVGGTLAMNACSAAMLISATRFFPKPQMDWKELKGVVSFSLNLAGFNVLNYFGRNTDSFLIGRFLGAASLGYYQFAYTLMLFPIQNISHQLGRVLLPALSHLQDDDQAFRKTYLRSCAAIAIVTFPMMVGLMATATPLILTLLGPRWLPVARIITVLAAVGMMQSVLVTVGNIYIAKGRTDLLLRTAILSNALVIPAFVIGLQWGAFGVAVAYALAYTFVSYFLFAYAFRLIDLRMSEFAGSLLGTFRYSLVMGACVWALRLLLDALSITRPVIVLACCVVTGITIYIILLIAAKPPVLVDLARSKSFDFVPGMRQFTRLFA